ncbi:CAP domain-containing protein [Pseudomonas oryzihabitans]|uniref:CAP domain-containing protein n=1 Tax=Pseudomonas oryzihabitans TaxID=47885 RepID=UPI00289431D5|nr:CAP domain-containing protein [Pseudomonas oryzihabitans]MDT3719963.1 CAP domain-containing protein [Pseudomonas oryzihabitans]
MSRLLAVSLLLTTGLLADAALAATPEEARLLELINAYRAAPQGCPGTRAAAPLAADNRLAAVRLTGRDRLQGDLRAAGYQAAAVQVILLAGAPTAQAAMAGLRQQYCRPLAGADYAQIGVTQQGPRWQLVLARPVVSAGLGDWQTAGKAVLAEVNRARAQGRTCGTRRFAATAPLRWNLALANAALAHSQDMASRNYFAHSAPGGGSVAERVAKQGYGWTGIGENIAAGAGSVSQAMQGWLASPGHCANLMNPEFTEMGAAYALNPRSTHSLYWTQVFGRPR